MAQSGDGRGEGGDEGGAGGSVPGLTPGELALLAGEIGTGASHEYALFAEAATEEDWKKDAARREHARTQRFRDHFDLMVVASMWVLISGFWVLAAVWALNVALGPVAWLKDDQVNDLQGILTGGLLLGFLTKHIERRIDDKNLPTQ